MLVDGRPYQAWLTDTADRLRYPPPPAAPSAAARWSNEVLFLPPWASEQTVELVSGALRAAARDAEPLAAEHGRHAWTHQMQEAGRVASHLAFEGAAAGLPLHSPYCDDVVLTACLRIRPHEATDPWSYKPLLAAAMDGLVPAHLLNRTTKDHGGTEWQQGLVEHRRGLADWAETSRLVAAGVADEEPLRRALVSPGLLIGGAGMLETTLGAEEWLRDLEAHPVPGYLAASEGALP
jgi:asparagine synthase (glutamine-hydrolysing)